MTVITRRSFLRRAGLSAAAAAFPIRQPGLSLDGSRQQKLAHDRLRPQYHLLPAANWMNDPNGPIFDRGQYHMFYQYNPNGAFWGSMHWGHATSPDMVHWRHEPVAIAPTAGGFDRDGVFSGSAVLDGETPTVIYTGVMPAASESEVTLDDGHHRWREVQCLATSKDADLRTWQKLPEPIIAHPPKLAITGFRDPGVWREDKEWLLTLGSGIKGKGGAVLLYESRDLRHWTYRHALIEGHGTGRVATNPVDNGEMWECPDFFPLGDRHVLIYATMGKVLWTSGRYRERRFHAEREGVVDHGAYYAAKTMVDANGKRILWGWIPETRRETEYRAAGWAGLMGLPRELSLDADGFLESSVAPAMEILRSEHSEVRNSQDREEKKKALAGIRIHRLAGELRAEFDGGRAFVMRLRSENGEPYAEIGYDPQRADAELRVNAVTGALRTDQPVSLRAFIDGSALEVCANRRTAITARVYTAPHTPLKVEISETDALRSFDAWQMTPISNDRLTT